MGTSKRQHETITILEVHGPLRLGDTLDQFRQAVDDSLAAGLVLIVADLADAPSIDSSGIGLLVRTLTSTKQRGGNLRLSGLSKYSVQTLKLVGVLNLFDVYPDLASALAERTVFGSDA